MAPACRIYHALRLQMAGSRQPVTQPSSTALPACPQTTHLLPPPGISTKPCQRSRSVPADAPAAAVITSTGLPHSGGCGCGCGCDSCASSEGCAAARYLRRASCASIAIGWLLPDAFAACPPASWPAGGGSKWNMQACCSV